ncbi:hypothetical protein QBC34DRAFT_217520 [Podospora aff. communis PSN243]|uniref:Uncharacterized protein n=1 Tax=Podospora aff. communis PSN243 TaxID=3040156 RepID=A0AAV9GYU7_9PEZI|nr:hypothetical protein QBC34DRAFT_217520 [Podospora aff. communis PSN243]
MGSKQMLAESEISAMQSGGASVTRGLSRQKASRDSTVTHIVSKTLEASVTRHLLQHVQLSLTGQSNPLKHIACHAGQTERGLGRGPTPSAQQQDSGGGPPHSRSNHILRFASSTEQTPLRCPLKLDLLAPRTGITIYRSPFPACINAPSSRALMIYQRDLPSQRLDQVRAVHFGSTTEDLLARLTGLSLVAVYLAPGQSSSDEQMHLSSLSSALSARSNVECSSECVHHWPNIHSQPEVHFQVPDGAGGSSVFGAERAKSGSRRHAEGAFGGLPTQGAWTAGGLCGALLPRASNIYATIWSLFTSQRCSAGLLMIAGRVRCSALSGEIHFLCWEAAALTRC